MWLCIVYDQRISKRSWASFVLVGGEGIILAARASRFSPFWPRERLPPGCGQPPAAARRRPYAAIALIAAGIAILAHFVSRVIVSRHLRGLSRGAAFNKFRARIKSLGSGRRGRRQAPRPTWRCPSLKKVKTPQAESGGNEMPTLRTFAHAKINRANRRCAARSKKLPAFGARLTKFELADH